MLWVNQPSKSRSDSSSASDDDSRYTASHILVAGGTAAATVAATLTTVLIYKRYIRRIPIAPRIPTTFLRTRTVFGKVTSVGDGDNFRLYHTPGGRLLGWGWLRQIPSDRLSLKDQTIHVRLAGVDAPECAHFGNPAQPFSKQALDWLRSYLLGSRVRARVWHKDQYERVVATVYIQKGLWRRDVGLEMLKAGMATVYEAKQFAEFGGSEMEARYRETERIAKLKKVGMWGLTARKRGVSPRDYKTALKVAAEGK